MVPESFPSNEPSGSEWLSRHWQELEETHAGMWLAITHTEAEMHKIFADQARIISTDATSRVLAANYDLDRLLEIVRNFGADLPKLTFHKLIHSKTPLV